MKKVSVTLK